MDLLSVQGNRIVNSRGESVRLRGTCPGGWMNMEDFINGYPGAEHTLRTELANVLGASKAEFFFERMADHFFGEDDIIYLKRLGATVVRLPLNYRHFEDDRTPFTYKEAGFKRLGQVIRWCDKHGIYVILDLHAVQGWQNVHWHSDNASRHNLFWHTGYFQDRFIALWQEFARRYAGESAVAGYNLMNEPCVNNPDGDQPWNVVKNYTPDWPLMNAVYRRTVEAIRKIDPKHIIFLEGDQYSRLFSGLDEPFADNLVYSSHNYNAAGFGQGAYPGVIKASARRGHGPEHWDLARQESTFREHEGTVYTDRHRVPLWIGEFGAVYNGPAEEVPDRLRAMHDQIGVFERHGAHWTTWNYKDIGVMGVLTLDPNSEYMQRVGGLIRKKELLGTDDWMSWMPPTPVKQAAIQLADQIHDTIGDDDIDRNHNRACLSQTVLSFYAGALMQRTYAGLFKGLSDNELNDVLASFSCGECKVNEGLAGILAEYMALPQ